MGTREARIRAPGLSTIINQYVCVCIMRVNIRRINQCEFSGDFDFILGERAQEANSAAHTHTLVSDWWPTAIGGLNKSDRRAFGVVVRWAQIFVFKFLLSQRPICAKRSLIMRLGFFSETYVWVHIHFTAPPSLYPKHTKPRKVLSYYLPHSLSLAHVVIAVGANECFDTLTHEHNKHLWKRILYTGRIHTKNQKQTCYNKLFNDV